MKRTSVYMLLLAADLIIGSPRVLADDLLGFYVGAAIGEAHVRRDKEIIGDTNYDYSFDGQHTAWTVSAGIRPISPLGVELEYTDFGNPSPRVSATGLGALTQASARALALYGIGYLPLPLPFLEVFGKLGIARLHATTTELPPAPACPAGATPCGTSSFDITDSSTNLAYGAGIAAKTASLAIRAEYGRIAASGGNPDIFSLGVTWTF